jgi:hypothetical protein
LSSSSVASAIDYLADCGVDAVRLHAARTLGSPRRFGPIHQLREAAERDMFARDVRDLFLLSYVEARRNGRLRGDAAGILGPLLSANASVALEALLARGCYRPTPTVEYLLDDMLSRAHPRGFFYEPHQERIAHTDDPVRHDRFLRVTATYARYLLIFGRGRDRRVRAAFDWLVQHQEEDGTWRPRPTRWRTSVDSYVLTRAVAQAFAELPASGLKRFGAARRRLASGWASRILERCEEPDAVLTEVIVSEDPRGPASGGDGLGLPDAIRGRVLYFPLEDLRLAVAIGAPPDHSRLAPWIEWLERTQLADGSWRLGNPGLRERLLLSDPNGRLRAEALHLTDEWITLRAAQTLRLARSRNRAEPSKTARVAASV